MGDEPGRVLDPAVTTALIRETAGAGRFLSFGQVAAANGLGWARVRRSMGGHLRAVCAASLAREGPMVSAIVVNRRHVGTGAMEDETLAGFLTAARELGFAWECGRSFLREQQRATFAWAEGASGPSPVEGAPVRLLSER